MPEIGGLRLCRRIRKTDSTTPIVFFTNFASKPNRNKALSAGANEFLDKVYDLDNLIPTIARLLASVDEVSA